MCSSRETIDLIPVTLPNGETVYTTWPEALGANLGLLVTTGIESLTDWLAAIGPAKVLLWTGTAGAVLFALVLAATAEGSRERP